MRIIDCEKWQVASSGTREIVFTSNKSGDNVASEFYVNPLSDCAIAVKGYVSPDDTTGIALKCVDIANMEKKNSITSAGDYLFMVGSFYKVSLSVTGTADIILKWNL